jgi:hypothetical protein
MKKTKTQIFHRQGAKKREGIQRRISNRRALGVFAVQMVVFHNS